MLSIENRLRKLEKVLSLKKDTEVYMFIINGDTVKQSHNGVDTVITMGEYKKFRDRPETNSDSTLIIEVVRSSVTDKKQII